MIPFPNKKYKIIYCDPAWYFKTYSDKGNKRSALQHYDCLNIDDIYNFNLKFKNNLILNFTIEVLARPKAIRNIDLISDKGRISYNHDDQIFNILSNLMSSDIL